MPTRSTQEMPTTEKKRPISGEHPRVETRGTPDRNDSSGEHRIEKERTESEHAAARQRETIARLDEEAREHKTRTDLERARIMYERTFNELSRSVGETDSVKLIAIMKGDKKPSLFSRVKNVLGKIGVSFGLLNTFTPLETLIKTSRERFNRYNTLKQEARSVETHRTWESLACEVASLETSLLAGPAFVDASDPEGIASVVQRIILLDAQLKQLEPHLPYQWRKGEGKRTIDALKKTLLPWVSQQREALADLSEEALKQKMTKRTKETDDAYEQTVRAERNLYASPEEIQKQALFDAVRLFMGKDLTLEKRMRETSLQERRVEEQQIRRLKAYHGQVAGTNRKQKNPLLAEYKLETDGEYPEMKTRRQERIRRGFTELIEIYNTLPTLPRNERLVRHAMIHEQGRRLMEQILQESPNRELTRDVERLAMLERRFQLSKLETR